MTNIYEIIYDYVIPISLNEIKFHTDITNIDFVTSEYIWIDCQLKSKSDFQWNSHCHFCTNSQGSFCLEKAGMTSHLVLVS